MGADHAGLAGLTAPDYDRFAAWPRRTARLALAVVAALMLLAALAPGYSPPPPPPPKVIVSDHAGRPVARQEDDNDVRLYRLIIARVAAGDSYYHAAVEEQRRNHYPVVPGFTVRLPTLAILSAWLGERGMIALGIALFAAMILAMHRRLADEPGGPPRVAMALGLLVAGLASGLNHKYNVIHEIWAAQLMALAFALHRPAEDPRAARWGWSWLVAALALAVRELVLPFVVLMAARAAWARQWREAGAWAALIGGYAALLAVHVHLVGAQVHPGDPVSPSWIAIKGIAGLLYKINNTTLLALPPVWISGICVILALLGWAGWRTPMGTLGFLLTAGYAFGFMIAGRDNNFYWGLLITPLLFMGAAFLPIALPSLWRRAALLPAGRRPAAA